jgi:DNA-binding beta-propeller fold protein YncE
MVALRKIFVFAILPGLLTTVAMKAPLAQGSASGVPMFKVDPFWPNSLPNNWIIGQVPGVAVDSDDHVWIIHRPRSLTTDEKFLLTDPPTADCCTPAPPVIEFDANGNILQSWGGPGPGYDWPPGEHGLFIDHKDNVWVTGNSGHVVLKFTHEGKFLLQIGVPGKTAGSSDPKLLGGPSDIAVDSQANEIYVSDGYANHRVTVFDADTGAYKRHWGAYGKKPQDDPQPPYNPASPRAQQFGVVHCVGIATDGLVYVCDRTNDRVQVFKRDGSFVDEVVVAKNTLSSPPPAGGSTWDLAFSADPQQRHLYVADGTNNRVWLLDRLQLRVIGAFGRNGRMAGHLHWVHALAVDSKGNIYTGEVDNGKRVQKFIYQGVS